MQNTGNAGRRPKTWRPLPACHRPPRQGNIELEASTRATEAIEPALRIDKGRGHHISTGYVNRILHQLGTTFGDLLVELKVVEAC
jgi:hypothetical protein